MNHIQGRASRTLFERERRKVKRKIQGKTVDAVAWSKCPAGLVAVDDWIEFYSHGACYFGRVVRVDGAVAFRAICPGSKTDVPVRRENIAAVHRTEPANPLDAILEGVRPS